MASLLTRYNPALDLWADHRHMLDRFFEEFFGEFVERRGEGPTVKVPAIDVSETDSEYLVRAEMPGLSQDNIEVSLDNGVLTISGKRETENREENEKVHRIERTYSAFERRIAVPRTVDPDRVSATYKDGVLEVRLPKTEESKPRRIEVKAQK